jgi:hypothetical protein
MHEELAEAVAALEARGREGVDVDALLAGALDDGVASWEHARDRSSLDGLAPRVGSLAGTPPGAPARPGRAPSGFEGVEGGFSADGELVLVRLVPGEEPVAVYEHDGDVVWRFGVQDGSVARFGLDAEGRTVTMVALAAGASEPFALHLSYDGDLLVRVEEHSEDEAGARLVRVDLPAPGAVDVFDGSVTQTSADASGRTPETLIAVLAAALERGDREAVRLTLHPYLHWTLEDGTTVRGRCDVLELLADGRVPAPPSLVEARDGQIYRWRA